MAIHKWGPHAMGAPFSGNNCKTGFVALPALLGFTKVTISRQTSTVSLQKTIKLANRVDNLLLSVKDACGWAARAAFPPKRMLIECRSADGTPLPKKGFVWLNTKC